MNAFLQSAINHLDAALDAVEARVRGLQDELSATEADYRAKDREVWRYRKELSALQSLEPQVESLREENVRLKEMHEELDERLRRVLEYTHALSETFR